jgi:hypothetical protein
MEETKQLPEGHWAREDAAAVSASPHLPAFIARPPGSPAYYGFPLLADSEKDGFIFGIISDVRGDPPPSWGDAYVVAPDGSRAGIEWRMTGADVKVALPPEPGRWGVYVFRFVHPVRSEEDLIKNLHAVLPHLKQFYAAAMPAGAGNVNATSDASA